jgi:pyruvate/2-oxoglutarate dehydrogenase complex dihydrolipoamide dehydrogenase (E3) component
VKHAEDHYTVSFKSPDGPEQSLEVGLVMMATGRSPRTAGLGLEVSADCHHIHFFCVLLA